MGNTLVNKCIKNVFINRLVVYEKKGKNAQKGKAWKGPLHITNPGEYKGIKIEGPGA